MRKLSILIALLLLLISSVIRASDFIITRDTVQIAIEGTINESLVVGDKYYCFFEKRGQNSIPREKKMYILSSDGTIEQCIDDLPKDFKSYYSDFYLKGDSVLLKNYYNSNTYYFDLKENKWVLIQIGDDTVYTDDNFSVISYDFGEWGGNTCFTDKKTGKKYHTYLVPSIINKLDDSYFLTTWGDIFEVKNPYEMHQCVFDLHRECDLHSDKFDYNLYYDKGVVRMTKQSTKSIFQHLMDKCPEEIRTSFIANKKLYHLLQADCMLYIATLENKEFIKHEVVISPFSAIRSSHAENTNYRYPIRQDGSQVLKFRAQNGRCHCFMIIRENTIALHYIDNLFGGE